MISHTTATELIESLARLREALQELALMVSDFQFDFDASSRQDAEQQTEQLLNSIRQSDS